MIPRREFLHGAYVTLLLIPLASAACSSTPGTGGGSCDGVQSTSSVALSHTHTVCVLASDLSSPPPSGATYTTSGSSGHTHQISLSHDQLGNIQAGQSVAVTSTNVQGHTHDFAIMKSAAQT